MALAIGMNSGSSFDGIDAVLVEVAVGEDGQLAPPRFIAGISVPWPAPIERHDNVLVATAAVPALLAAHGVQAEVRAAFGSERLPEGLMAIVGAKAPA